MEIEQAEKQEESDMNQREDWSRLTPEYIEDLLRTFSSERTSDRAGELSLGYLVWVKSSLGPEQISETIKALQARGIAHLRTGISWAEWHDPDNPQNREWIKHYIREYAAAGLHVMPCLTFTPPDLGIMPAVNSPPKDPRTYGVFVDDVCRELGDCFVEVELSNEWNLETDWDLRLDPEYQIFMEMIRIGAEAAHSHGKRVVLGGASRINTETRAVLEKFSQSSQSSPGSVNNSKNSLKNSIDVVGFHNLRGTWSDKIPSEALSVQAENIRTAWGDTAQGIKVPVYLTEYGFPVVDPEKRFNIGWLEDIQVALFAYSVYAVVSGAIDRVYWYTYKDHVSPSLRFAVTGWEDVLQHHFGDTREDGTLRKLGRLLLAGGPLHVLRFAVEHRLMSLVDEASLGRVLQHQSAA